ncbi:hypothetical protein WMF31_09590 [Sorangium sp. So ce1036]
MRSAPKGAVIDSLFGSMLAFVPALGPVLGALLADQLGWRAIFPATAGSPDPARHREA